MQLKALNERLDLLGSPSLNPTDTNQSSQQRYSATTGSRQHEPQQPLFVGHTQSAFSLDVAKTSLSQMGIPPDTVDPASELQSLAPSPRDLSPEPHLHPITAPDSPSVTEDPLLTIPLSELFRLITIFHEEIESLYPFIDSDELMAVARTKTEKLAMHISSTSSEPRPNSYPSDDRDVDILKIAVAIAVVIEARGKNTLSSKLVDSTDKKAAQVTRSLDVDLRDLQWLTLMVCPSDMPSFFLLLSVS